MDEYERALSQFREVVAARQAGNSVAEQRLLNDLQTESDAFEEQSKEYGFKECGQG